jgi:glutathione S-transferase
MTACSCKVSNMLPRPEITDLLGVKYRRIPILAIGNDIYCDSNIIIPALERRFPTSKGYGTVFPTSEDGKWTDTGMIKAFAKFYADGALFTPVLGLLPWTSQFPEEFIKDRGEVGS